MDSKELLEMLNKERLLPYIRRNVPVLKKVLKRCLDARDEHVLLVMDRGFFNRRLSPMLGATYLLAAEELGMDSSVMLQDPKNKGDVAEDKVLNALKRQKDKNIVITNVSVNLGKLTHVTKSFRETMRLKSNKFTSMSSLGGLENRYYPVVINAIDVDYKVMQDTADRLKSLLDKGTTVHISTKAGTSLKMSIKCCNAIANDGRYGYTGRGGNIPAGEVYIPPVEGTAEGKAVIDGSIRHRKGTMLVKEPVILEIRKGSIISVKGDIESKMLGETMAWAEGKARYPENVMKIAELGIGVNPNCRVIGQTTVDEKTIGTCHIANGSNSWFGGSIKSMIHLDHVMKDVTLRIDDEEIIVDGKHVF